MSGSRMEAVSLLRKSGPGGAEKSRSVWEAYGAFQKAIWKEGVCDEYHCVL